MHIVRLNMLITLANTAVLLLASSCLSADELPHQGPPQLPVLTAEDGQYTVFDPLLNEHSFTQHDNDNNELIANANTSGTLVHLAGQHYRWTDGNGEQHRFEGSQYVGLERNIEALQCLPLPDPDSQPVEPTSDSSGTEEGNTEGNTEGTTEGRNYRGPQKAPQKAPKKLPRKTQKKLPGQALRKSRNVMLKRKARTAFQHQSILES